MSSKLDFDFSSPKEPKAPNLVFIHGAGGDKTQWEMQKPYFQKHGWGVINLSLPSHGQSPPSTSLSMDIYVETIHKLIVDKELENVVLIGHSMGGAIALQFVLRYNNSMIDKLVLIGTGAKLRVSPLFFEALETDFDYFLELLTRVSFHENTASSIKDNNEEVLRRNGGVIFFQDFKICDLFDIRSELHRITNQTLIIVGQHDQMTPVKYSSYLHENIANSKIVIIPEAGHNVFQEKILAVNKQIYNFIKTTGE
ncbi:MAG: alpha/beta fold hydrolase [Candidatus Hodarchaeota archaeon]